MRDTVVGSCASNSTTDDKHMARKWGTVLGISLLALPAWSAEQVYTTQPSVTPELAKPGAWAAGVTTLSITNPEQLNADDLPNRKDRELTLEVWYPAAASDEAPSAVYEDVTRTHQPFAIAGAAKRGAAPAAGPFPLIVMSHGYTGYRTIMFYLGEHLASHGYVVASIDHPGSTNAEIDFVNNRGAGFASTLLHRARDQQFVLEKLSALESDLGRVIDGERAAVIGYSMGGYGAVNVVGGCYRYTAEIVQSFGIPESVAPALVPVYSGCSAWRDAPDPRWKAVVAFAPWGQTRGLHDLGALTVPSLFIAGEDDDISGFETGVRQLFEQTASDDKYLLVYENARHNIAPHPAPSVAYGNDADLGHYAEPAWDVEQLNRVNEHMTLAFLDCHVKERGAACGFLPAREDVTQTRLPNGELTPAWPGFGDRWGTGIRFYRGD